MSPAATLHPSELVLQAIAGGAPIPTDAAAHLEGCARCRAAIDETREARELFTRQVYARTLPAVAAEALGFPWRRWLLPLVLAPALAALVFLLPGRLTAPKVETEPGASALGIKGAQTLRVFVRRGDQVSQVSSGETLAPGDQLRFQIEPAGLPYVLIVSVDSAGATNVYLPFEGKQSQAIDGQRTLLSPDSVVLDATPGPERVFALFSRAPLSAERVEPLLKAIGAGGPAAVRDSRILPLETDGQVSFLWEKERR